MVQNVQVAGLCLRDPASARRDPGKLVAGEDRVGVILAEDPQAQDEELAIVGLGLLPPALPGGDPGEFVQGGQCPRVLGTEYLAPVGEDLAEYLTGFTEPVPGLVGDHPCELVACERDPGIRRV